MAALGLLCGAAWGAPEVEQDDAATGPLAARLAAPDGADLVVLYGGEQGGDLGTCGCESRPLGSLARVEGYRRAVVRRGDPVLLVSSGGTLDASVDADGRLRPDSREANAAMIEGLRAGAWTVWNVGVPDLPYLIEVGFPPEAVSANLRPDDPDAPRPATHRIVHVGGRAVGVTGVSRAPETIAGWGADDPFDALRGVLAELRAHVDVVVVLAYHPGREVESLVRLPGVDVLIEAGGFEARWPAVARGAGLWARSDHQTRRLGELRLWLGEDGVSRSVDRHVDLDARIPSPGPARRRAARSAARVEAVQRETYGVR